MNQPRIVHITPILPVIGGNGLAMRTSMFAEAAARAGECTCLVIGQPEPRLTEFALPAGVQVEVLDAAPDTRLKLISIAQPPAARAQMLVQYGRPVLTSILSATMMQSISKRLEEIAPDLVILSRAYLLPLLDGLPEALSDTPIAVDLDDDDAAFHLALSRLSGERGDTSEAAMLDAEAMLFDRMIKHHASRVARFWIASKASRTIMDERLKLPHLAVISNAVHLPAAPAVRDYSGQSLLFVGNLQYKPNLDGIDWFIKQVLPRVRKQIETVQIIVAGSGCPAALRELCHEAGVKLVENPGSLDAVYRTASAAIVPVRAGSGSRLKIIEAGTHTVPVISTRSGADGLDLDPDHHLVQSEDDAQSFAEACVFYLSRPDEASRRAEALRQHVALHHNRKTVVEDIAQQLEGLITC
jgi:glycosyltransferase involved in cell wall biosynthesis